MPKFRFRLILHTVTVLWHVFFFIVKQVHIQITEGHTNLGYKCSKRDRNGEFECFSFCEHRQPFLFSILHMLYQLARTSFSQHLPQNEKFQKKYKFTKGSQLQCLSTLLNVILKSYKPAYTFIFLPFKASLISVDLLSFFCEFPILYT